MPEPPAWSVGDSDMAQRIRAFDWSATPLGPIERWPPCLRITLTTVLAHPTPMILAWGPELIALYNDAYRPLLGSKPEALGRPYLQVWNEAQDIVAPQLALALQGQTSQFKDAQFTILRGDRSEIAFFDYSYTPVRDETGAITGLINTAVETTDRVLSDRKQAEAENAFRQSESRLRALVTVRTSSIYRMSPDWQFMYQLDSDTLTNTTEPIEDWVEKYILQEDRPEVFSAIKQAIQTKSLFELEHRVRLADNRIGWVLSRAVPVLGPNGNILEWFGTGSDVTKRRRAESHLALLSDVSQDLARLTNIDEAMHSLGERIATHFGLSACALTELSESAEIAVINYDWHRPDTSSLVGTYNMREFVTTDILQLCRAGKAVVVHDVFNDPRTDGEQYAALNIRSFLCIPLVRMDEWQFLLVLYRSKPSTWKDDEIELAHELANRIWTRLERARAEAALQETQRHLATIFEAVPAGLALIDIGGKYLLSNHQMDELIPSRTIPSRDLPQQSRWRAWSAEGELLSPQDYPGARSLRGESVKPGLEMLHTNEDGSESWVTIASVPVHDDRGQITGIVTVATDVDKLKRTETALRESEDRQAFLLNLSDLLRPLSDPFQIQAVAMNLLGKYLDVNRALYFQVLPDLDTLQAGPAYIHDVAEAPVRVRMSDFSQAMLNGYQLGHTIVTNDVLSDERYGSERAEAFAAIDVRAAIGVPLIKDGHLIAILTVHQKKPRTWSATDVLLLEEVAQRTWATVERSRVQAALHESDERFRLFVENVREYALVQTNFEGIITSWNPGAERLFGYTSEEIIGKPFSMLLTFEDRDKGIIAREMAKLSEGKRNVDACTLQRKDDSRFWAEWITEPVFDDNSELRGTAKVMRDETERQQAEEALRSSLSEKEALLSEVHHRVKNNLQVITSLLNLQAKSIKDEAALTLFIETRNRVASIATIHEMLYRSKSFAAIDLVAYARQLVWSLISFYGLQPRVKAVIEGKDVELQLEQAVPLGLLLNELTSNALKHGFAETKTGVLLVRLVSENGYILLKIEDNGVGLPKNFHPEQQSSLGLKLVQILIKQLRGEINFHSEAGTQVSLRIPVKARSPNDERTRARNLQNPNR